MPAVGQQLNLAWLARLEADQQPPGDRPAVDPRLGDLDPHQSVAFGHVVLPAAPDDCIAMAHQEPVAGIGRRRGLIGRGTPLKVASAERLPRFGTSKSRR